MTSKSRPPLPPHLLPDREVHVIISLLSGHRKAQGYYDDTLKPFLDSYGVTYSTHTTKSAKSITELTTGLILPNATKGVKQTIVLLSGDGGVVDIVDTLTSRLNRSNDDIRRPSVFIKPVIALVPMGTANALAWSSKVAHDPLQVMMTGTPKSLPSFQARFSPGAKLVVDEGQGREEPQNSEDDETIMYGAVVFSWGLHASLVAMSDTTEYRKHGLERFRMAAEQLLKDSHRYRGKVKWRKAGGEWTELSGPEHSYILASLVSNLEEKFQISPATRPVDGTLRLVHIGPESASEIMRLLGLAYQSGQHVADPKVTYEDIDGLRVEFDEEDEQWRLVCVDGKIVAIARGGWVEVTRIPGSGIDGRRVIELVC
ncbi:hypothetical protein LTR99_000442 [Exophiala xenobiotica]|uniref:DAGKc domain-containing protein n=1 Tax=Vermiconidia calcicola TaxID=1690605 RepID=A0AAV9QH99_9PEZI|nr:hypothetical protein LTR92_003137 [Exophiala xenobiotica]KAK5543731.1 hypothetical protein LTR25_001345 [Vermiconidia calcicola]KAK5548408.1 hypothetical protein LTR23_001537 [Chaetothyriales sp. CCFEE 6169]KAK5231244.1 hypothetical protein LTR72_000424 [Exophiala xenobiotica]KAK5237818.1 hypothetical protein LTR47_000911 [Exophiala xenobiotica]